MHSNVYRDSSSLHAKIVVPYLITISWQDNAQSHVGRLRIDYYGVVVVIISPQTLLSPDLFTFDNGWKIMNNTPQTLAALRHELEVT